MAGLVNPGSAVSFEAYSQFDNFKRSIKRDPTLFPIFKNQALWENWNRNNVAIACNQNIYYVLYNTYVPSTPDHMDLFGAGDTCT